MNVLRGVDAEEFFQFEFACLNDLVINSFINKLNGPVIRFYIFCCTKKIKIWQTKRFITTKKQVEKVYRFKKEK